MGMYDYINGEQVKCFRVPVYYGRDGHSKYGIGTMGGHLRGFKNGEIVPFNTFNYNYGKDFMIFDENPEYFEDVEALDELIENMDNTECKVKEKEEKLKFCMHVIRDGKVFGSFYEISPLEEFFKDNKLVLGYTGEILNIKDANDIINFIKEQKEFRNQRNIYFEEYNKAFKDFMKVGHGIGALDKESEEYAERSKKFNECNKLLEEAREAAIKNFEPISSAYSSKWFSENKYELEETFGEFIDAYLYLLKGIDKYPEDEHYNKSFKEISIELREFVSENDILDKYLNWNKGLSLEQIEIVKELVKSLR